MSPRYSVQAAPPGIGRTVSDLRALGVNPLGRAVFARKARYFFCRCTLIVTLPSDWKLSEPSPPRSVTVRGWLMNTPG